MSRDNFEYDPYDHAVQNDPYPYYRKLRDQHPVYYNEKLNFYALSRYDDILSALRNSRVFCSKMGPQLEHGEMPNQLPTVMSLDPPDHTRVRRVLQSEFTPSRIALLEDEIRMRTRALLAPCLEGGSLDVFADVAMKVPTATLCHILGIPREDEDMLRDWTDAIVHRDSGQYESNESNADAGQNLLGYFSGIIRERDEQGIDKEDLIGKLVRARNAGELSQMEVLGYLFIGAIGGHETTAKTIGNTMYQLWRNRSQRKILLDDMDLLPSCIDETVRFDGPVHLLCRTTSQDVEMHGVRIPEGSKVALLYIAGNRDHRKYEDAESYLVARKCRDHLGFGGGIHACQGSALGRLQSRVVVEEILRAIPDYEVVEQGLARMHSPSVRGFTKVPVTF